MRTRLNAKVRRHIGVEIMPRKFLNGVDEERRFQGVTCYLATTPGQFDVPVSSSWKINELVADAENLYRHPYDLSNILNREEFLKGLGRKIEPKRNY